MSPQLNLKLNPNPAISRQQITPDYSCLIIDEFLLNPDEAVEWVASQRERFTQFERSYPGIILPVTDQEVRPLHAWVKSSLSREFNFLRGNIKNHSQFSMATMQPEEFSWIQRLPHSDPRLEEGRNNIAVLLYLFDNPELGGTGFYRWRDPDFWSELSDGQRDDPEAGLDILRDRFEMFRSAPSYTTESNEAVELLAMVPARYNRLVCYSGDLPHSAFIKHPELLSKEVGKGRLTLNCFASVWPR